MGISDHDVPDNNYFFYLRLNNNYLILNENACKKYIKKEQV